MKRAGCICGKCNIFDCIKKMQQDPQFQKEIRQFIKETTGKSVEGEK